MATDVLTLGPFVLEGFAAPERLPFGGRQQLVIHRLPGGGRVVDAMGGDDIDRAWTGTLWGDDAMPVALALDALRSAAEPLVLSNAAETRLVVITEFLPLVRKITCVEYSIILTPVDGGAPGGPLGALLDLGAQVAADIAAALP